MKQQGKLMLGKPSTHIPPSRRGFLAAFASAACLRLHADPLGMPVACQTYPVRDALGKDVDGTLRQLAAIGYRGIEMCSPAGYVSSGFGPLTKVTVEELRQKIRAAGLDCQSCHFQFRELKEKLNERIAFAKALGLRQMVLSSFGLPKDASMADWVAAADELNRIGDRVAKTGLQLGYHNHDMEFREIDGVLIYDRLMQQLDPKLVKMQFQVSVISKGFEAATFMRKYPGRFLSMHLQDWSPAENKEVAIGAGVVNWKGLFTAAKAGGVRNYFVELSMDMLKPSYEYLHELRA
jgi:sugar phosphate isomerase/epimerase